MVIHMLDEKTRQWIDFEIGTFFEATGVFPFRSEITHHLRVHLCKEKRSANMSKGFDVGM